ncbi:hypothetical protein CVT25_011553 [Psilocybe cyanescens]|uniref:Uncharacterized protein n=1 Tax=Psilocybe cyanescens TaxID=93625 RepID=A0A409VVC3_PSICY|nr:hypothetical protein CVT25_011553 [Psilocybe cyanescens]
MATVEEDGGGQDHASGQMSVDIKRYGRVEKIPVGEIKKSGVLSGVLFNKDIIYPAIRRLISNPRIIMFDYPLHLEYKKGESDEHGVQQGRGLATRAGDTFAQANASSLRCVRKSDNNRIALVIGATIVNCIEDIREAMSGRGVGCLGWIKLGMAPPFPFPSIRYFTFLIKCRAPKACTILLRGPSKHMDTSSTRLTPTSLTLRPSPAMPSSTHPLPARRRDRDGYQCRATTESAVQGVETWPYRAVVDAMEIR